MKTLDEFCKENKVCLHCIIPSFRLDIVRAVIQMFADYQSMEFANWLEENGWDRRLDGKTWQWFGDLGETSKTIDKLLEDCKKGTK